MCRVVDVLRRQVEITAEVDPWRIADGRLQLTDSLLHGLRIERILLVRVRTGDNIGRARRGRHAHHGDRILQRLCSIVQPVQDMAVDIDHDFMRSSLRYRVLRSTPRLRLR